MGLSLAALVLEQCPPGRGGATFRIHRLGLLCRGRWFGSWARSRLADSGRPCPRAGPPVGGSPGLECGGPLPNVCRVG
eukprot:6155608-Alexandrium_andersonii.AAC.1